jgi:hypothetical protein
LSFCVIRHPVYPFTRNLLQPNNYSSFYQPAAVEDTVDRRRSRRYRRLRVRLPQKPMHMASGHLVNDVFLSLPEN